MGFTERQTNETTRSLKPRASLSQEHASVTRVAGPLWLQVQFNRIHCGPSRVTSKGLQHPWAAFLFLLYAQPCCIPYHVLHRLNIIPDPAPGAPWGHGPRCVSRARQADTPRYPESHEKPGHGPRGFDRREEKEKRETADPCGPIKRAVVIGCTMYSGFYDCSSTAFPALFFV